MSNVIPIGRHWPGGNLVDFSKVTTSLSKQELIAAGIRMGVHYSMAANAMLTKRKTNQPDPTKEIVLASDEVSREQRVYREVVLSYYMRKGLMSLSQQLLLEVLAVPRILKPGHYCVLVGTEGDCFALDITRNGSNLCTKVEQILPGSFVYHRETWLMQRAIKTYYEGGK
jgi:hypothetical protein